MGESMEAGRSAEGEPWFHLIAERAPIQVWIADVRGDLEYCNERWLDYARRSQEEVRADGWHALIHPDEIGEFLTAWRSACRTGRRFEMTCRLVGADGTARRFLIQAEPLVDENGTVLRWYGLNTAVDNPADEADANGADPGGTDS